jgi:hypothetical protein
MPVNNVASSVVQSAETARPEWLPQEVAVPIAPIPAGLPLIEPSAPNGPIVYTPSWASETPPPATLSLTKKVLLWAGLVLSGAMVLYGFVGIPVALTEFGAVRSNTLTGAVVLILVGGAIFAPCLAVLLGFGPVVTTTLSSLGILGCFVVLTMVINTAVAVTFPGGGVGRLVVPWGTVVLVVFRAWRGRWLGAGIIAVVWAVSTTIILLNRS